MRICFLTLLMILLYGSVIAQTKVTFPSPLMAGVKQEVKIISENDSVFISLPSGSKFISTIDETTVSIVSTPNQNYILNIDGKEYASTNKAIPLWMSILPPLIAIFLAFFTKEVVLSILGGLSIGVMIIGFYDDGMIGILVSFFSIITDYIMPAIIDWYHASILLFTFLIGGMIAVVSKNGGIMGLVDKVSRFAKSPKSGQLTTYLLGFLIFFDDYSNSLVIGNTMKPICDKLKISREKLSYIVDSTAAPLVSIALIGVWVGAELNYIQSGLEGINKDSVLISESPFQLLISSLQFSFYPILTLLFVLMIILSQKDFGLMHHYESVARKGIEVDKGEVVRDATYEPTDKNSANPNILFALIPVGVLIVTVLAGIVVTGYDENVWRSNTGIQKLSMVMGASDSYTALLWSSFLAITVAVLMSIFSKRLTNTEAVESAISGIKDMLPISSILVLAWCLSALSEEMHTAQFLIAVLKGNLAPQLIPGITFILAGIIAFATGTSWGTMGILYPLILPTSFFLSIDAGLSPDQAMDIFLICTASVLAGAVFGDHCSPISDTTILSSLASGCNHINHVKTQIPYALTVATVALLVGILPASFGFSSLITIPICLVILWLTINYFGKPVADHSN
ncbi:MAG: Na+/H+ antiporter NhaC family protein [Bacteroidota bacterium]